MATRGSKTYLYHTPTSYSLVKVSMRDGWGTMMGHVWPGRPGGWPGEAGGRAEGQAGGWVAERAAGPAACGARSPPLKEENLSLGENLFCNCLA